MEDEKYNIAEAIEAQQLYCESKGYPHFAPYNGSCYSCHQQIYAPIEHQYGSQKWTSGYSVEFASSNLVTGCPHCNSSYVD